MSIFSEVLHQTLFQGMSVPDSYTEKIGMNI